MRCVKCGSNLTTAVCTACGFNHKERSFIVLEKLDESYCIISSIAAFEGVSETEVDLITQYETGKECFQSADYDAAIRWLWTPAKKGNANSQFLLGQIFDVSEKHSDQARAIYWYEQAAARGQEKSVEALIRLYKAAGATKRDKLLYWEEKKKNMEQASIQEDVRRYRESKSSGSSQSETKTQKNLGGNQEVQSSKDFKIKGKTLVKYLGSSSTPRVPDGIRIIEKKAFKYNKVVQSVTLPDTVIKIKEEAFYSCTNLHTVHLSPNLESIGEYAFAFSGLKNVSLPDSLSFLGKNVFYDTKIDKIRIPSRIETVPCEAFTMCKNLQEVELCHGVEAIADDAFDFCQDLKTIKIPDSLCRITTSWRRSVPFRGTDNISRVTASDRWKENHPDILRILLPSQIEDENFQIEDGVLVRYYGRKEDPVIPAVVTKIGEGAFEYNSHIRTIVLPEGICEIAYRAFSSCRSLQRIVFPKTLRKIGDRAFSLSNLEFVDIPGSVKTIMNGAFKHCDKLQEVILRPGVAEIAAEAFSGCWNLTTITIPDTLTTVDSYSDTIFNNPSFSECKKLKIVNASSQWKQSHPDLLDRILKPNKKRT